MNSRVGLIVAALLAATMAPVRSQAPQTATTPLATILFRIIVVESPDAAQRVRDQLIAGENFPALAQKLSVDATGRNGGLIGPVAIEDLRGELRAALEGLRPGELSGVVRVPTGFAIVKIVPAEEAGGGSSRSSNDSGVMGSGFANALSASGAVKYVFDISGYIETVLSLRQ